MYLFEHARLPIRCELRFFFSLFLSFRWISFWFLFFRDAYVCACACVSLVHRSCGENICNIFDRMTSLNQLNIARWCNISCLTVFFLLHSCHNWSNCVAVISFHSLALPLVLFFDYLCVYPAQIILWTCISTTLCFP